MAMTKTCEKGVHEKCKGAKGCDCHCHTSRAEFGEEWGLKVAYDRDQIADWRKSHPYVNYYE